MNTKKRVIIFSIENPGIQNAPSIYEYVESKLNVFGFKCVYGSYKGSLENSYVVNASEDLALEVVLGLARRFNQESILIVDENRVAKLHYLDGRQLFGDEKLGRLVSISALEARDLENWTLDGTNYYAVV